MKKNLTILLLLCVITLSCSDQTETINSTETALKDAVIISSDDPSLFQNATLSAITKNPDIYNNFVDSHSELWSTLKSSALTAIGYDSKQNLNSDGKTAFSISFAAQLRQYDSRVLDLRYATYLTNQYLYKKDIIIPQGATLILPPESSMSTYIPMGRIPGTTTYGYKATFISSSSSGDVYQFSTQVTQISYTISGAQVASVDNPIFVSTRYYSPSNFAFKYQYSSIEW
jgi:hypothetical protein